MTIFLASLAGIPPLGGWYAKFGVFNAVLTARSGWGYSIAVIGAVNAVIATAYYVTVMREMWMKPAPDGDVTPVRVPGSIKAALAITARRHAGVRRAARRDQLRRHHRARRCIRPLTRFGRRSSLPVERFASTSSCASPCMASTASTRRAARPVGVATSSPRRRSARCSARCWRGGSSRSGAASASPTTSRSSSAVPAPARSPAQCSRQRRSGATTMWRSRCRSSNGDSTRPGCGRCRAWPTESESTRCRHRQRTARQPSVPTRRVRRWLAGGGGVGSAGSPEFVETHGRAPIRRGIGCRRGATHGARVPIQDRAAAWVGTARRMLRQGTVMAFDYFTPSTAELSGRPWRDWLRTYQRPRPRWSLPPRSRHAGHHGPGLPRSAAVAAGRGLAARLPATMGDRRTGRGGPTRLGRGGRPSRRGGDDDAQPYPRSGGLCWTRRLGGFAVASWLVEESTRPPNVRFLQELTMSDAASSRCEWAEWLIVTDRGVHLFFSEARGGRSELFGPHGEGRQ